MSNPVLMGMIISILSLGAGGTSAYSMVKSDIAVNAEKNEQLEKQFNKIDQKLDKIIDRLIEAPGAYPDPNEGEANDTGE